MWHIAFKGATGVRFRLLMALWACSMAQSERAEPSAAAAACEIDTLLDEFGVIAVHMSVERHAVCCGSVRRFLKVAQSQTQPWKLEVSLLVLGACSCVSS
jgi:hypothetical protein